MTLGRPTGGDGPEVDVVILGGGPGGAAAGLTLLKRDGVSVGMVEASDYASPRIGEAVSPGLRPLLEYLDVWHAFRGGQALESFGSLAAWGSATPRSLDYLSTVHGTGWTLDRARLDRLLAEAFRSRGGRLMTRTRFLGCERTPHGWLVRLRDPRSRERRLRCRYLVDATGRPARLGRHLGVPRMIHDRLVGVARVGRLSEDVTLESMVQVEACEYGWWYTAPMPDNRVSAVLMSDVDLVRRLGAARAPGWDRLVAQMPLTRQRLAGARLEAGPTTFPAATGCLRRVGGDDWVAVGDAAASHDPLSSTGIPHAMASGTQGGLVAADALFAGGQALSAYERAVRDDFGRYLRTHWQYYQREARWPEAPFWARRRTAVDLAPDVVVEVAPAADVAFESSVHLSPRLSRELHASVVPGRPAHEIVQAFATEHPEVPDQRIILGMQDLVAHGGAR